MEQAQYLSVSSMVIEYFLEWVVTAPVSKRVEAATAMVRAYFRKDIEASEKEDLEAALTMLLEDEAVKVRVALASALGAHKGAPRHIVTALAGDVLEVSVIVLSRSPVFHDFELVDYVRTGEIDKQIAISCRPWLSDLVLDAICNDGCEEACMGVLANPVADFSKSELHCIAERFGASADIRNLLMDRTDLAAESRLLLITRLSTSLSTFVAGNNWISSDRAATVAREAWEKSAISFAASVSDEDVESIVKSLVTEGQLTVSFLLRAVCMGNITLVARAFSELSGIRFARVETILSRDRQSAFRAVYDRAGLPSSAFRIFASAIATWRRLLLSGSKINQERMPFIVTRDVLNAYCGEPDEIVDELLVLLRKLSAEAARESAKSKAMEIAKRAPEAVHHIAEISSEKQPEPERQAVTVIHTELVADEIDLPLNVPLQQQSGDQLRKEAPEARQNPPDFAVVANNFETRSKSGIAPDFIDLVPLEDDPELFTSDALLNSPVSRAA